MREEFHFVHRINPDLVYHAILLNDKYRVSWTDKHDKLGRDDYTHYSISDAERAIDKGDWIIQIV